MPRVKIDYIVSFSSEDTENPANNLLQWDISKKKWLCPRGESSCSVVLQLTKSTKISSVQIGAYHAALVEVLVGRSETPSDQFQVLVPSSVFLSPIDSRKEENVERVRSFNSENFTEATRDQKWDRLRVVCSQPYNKHCKFGLSFIQIYEPEDSSKPLPTAALPGLAFQAPSSDEDEFKPGQLFASYSQNLSGDSQNNDTGAQIRQATLQVLKNLGDESTKLVRTPKAKKNEQQKDSGDNVGDRKRDSLIYQDEDDQPHAKIDHVIQRHKDETTREQAKAKVTKKVNNSEDKSSMDSTKNKERPETNIDIEEKVTRTKDKPTTAGKHNDGDKEARKRRHSEMKDKKTDGEPLRAGPLSDEPHSLLRDVIFVLSGYQNPERARIRTAALAMGATCLPDWSPRCTHLVCAFPNTPKLRQVRGRRGRRDGAAAVVVKGDWVEQCAAQRRRLPWQWFATEPRHHVPPPPRRDDDEDLQPDSECDTDDEIEKVVNKEKKRKLEESPSPERGAEPPKGGDVSRGSDVEFVRDERIQSNVTIQDTDTDDTDEEMHHDEITIDESKVLPEFFDGYTFMIDKSVEDSKVDKELLSRYVRAYGGTLIHHFQLDEDSNVDYVLCGGGGGPGAPGTALRADWVWQCHRDKRLCPTDEYLLT